MKICIISSCGGHLTEVKCLSESYANHDYFYVLNKKIVLADDMKEKTIYITHSERDWRIILNLWEAFQVLRKRRPDVLLSTGAGPIVPFAIVGRLLFGTKVIFIETITRIHNPSLTGRIMYWLANDFYYQWEDLHKYFPRGQYGGPVL